MSFQKNGENMQYLRLHELSTYSRIASVAHQQLLNYDKHVKCRAVMPRYETH